MMPTRVLLCDTADGLAHLQYALLRSRTDLEVEAVTDGFRAVEAAARTQPEVVVAEIGLEGLAGAELVRRLIATAPQTRVLCWTVFSSPIIIAEALEAGAAGYLLKEDGFEELLRALHAVRLGQVVLGPRPALELARGLAAETAHGRDLEGSLAETSERLEQLTTAKADFLANVSHELRTPATVAKGIAYVLKRRGIPPEEEGDFLGRLEGALDKLMVLVDEMLTMADLERGTLDLKIAEIDLSPVLRQAADELERRYPQVPIQRAVPDTLPASADPVRITEVVRQLLDNACRYTTEGTPVEIRARSMEEGVLVSITDRGTGMQRSTATQAFSEPFSTGEEVLRKERDGAGVGLHLARQLVVQHGGIMWVDPVPAGGSRVSFCLPRHLGDTVTDRPDLAGDPSDDSAALSNVVPFAHRASTGTSS